MKKIIYLLVTVLAISLLVSCGQNEAKQALREMEKIVEKAEKEKNNLSKEEWKELAVEFAEYAKIANKGAEENKLGTKDKVKIATLSARFAAVSVNPITGMGESLLENLFSKINEALLPDDLSEADTDMTQDDKRWIVLHKNIILGNQHDNTNGHFLKLKTGETVKVGEAKGQEEYLAMLIYSDSYLHVTFPANAEEESLMGGFVKTRLFEQDPGGIKHWAPEKTTGGVLVNTEKINAADFNEIAKSNDPAVFDKAFRKCNGNSENIGYGSKCERMMKTGQIYLLQFNNLVRAIMLAKSVKDGKEATLSFDMIVEGREKFNDVDLARYLQPDEPMGNPTADAQEIKGNVTDCQTGKAIGGVTIQFEDKHRDRIKTVISNNAGEFSLAPDADTEELSARGKKPDYMSRVVEIGKNELQRYKSGGVLLEICMEKVDSEKALRLNNLHYDTGKADIRPEAYPELNRLVQFLNDNPQVRVELSSHTDSRSAADYNLKLSQRRADAAKKHIVSKGIAENRIVAVGYGETRLLNRCADGVACTEEEHQLNRRTEIKTIK